MPHGFYDGGDRLSPEPIPAARGELVVLVSYFGFPVDVKAARARGAWVVADASQAFSYRRDGEVYRIATAVAFSPETKEAARKFRAFVEQHPLVPNRGSITGRVALEGRLDEIARLRRERGDEADDESLPPREVKRGGHRKGDAADRRDRAAYRRRGATPALRRRGTRREGDGRRRHARARGGQRRALRRAGAEETQVGWVERKRDPTTSEQAPGGRPHLGSGPGPRRAVPERQPSFSAPC